MGWATPSCAWVGFRGGVWLVDQPESYGGPALVALIWSNVQRRDIGSSRIAVGRDQVVRRRFDQMRKFRYSDYGVVAADSEQGCDRFREPLTDPKSGLCEWSCPPASKLSDFQDGATGME